MRARLFLGWMPILVCVVALAACGGSKPSAQNEAATSRSAASGEAGSDSRGSASSGGPPVTFALMSIKIPGSDLLTGYSSGAQAAVKKINSEGGFGGRRVSVIRCNTMLETSGSTACARKTLVQHPVAMFGCDPLWSQAGLPVYAGAKIPSFNCLNTSKDGNDPESFALSPGGYGLQGAMARYLCSRSDVRTVVEFALDIPTYTGDAQVAAGKPLSACGKTLKTVFFPTTATDVSPYVAKVVADKPDFVILLPLSGVSGINIYKTLKQEGIPASRVIISESNLDGPTLKVGGAMMNGTYGAQQFDSWSDTANPDVAAYLQATRHSAVDPRDSNVEFGYANVMLFYEAAKRIGFANFNSASLTSFMDQTQSNGFRIPLSRSLVIPGPRGYAHERQPYGQIVQLHNGKLNIVKHGTKNGWVTGF